MFKVLIKDKNVKDGPEYVALDIDASPSLILEANEPLTFDYGLSFKTYNFVLLNTPKNNLLLDNLFNKNTARPVEFNDVYLLIDNIYFRSVLYIKSFDYKGAKSQLVSSAGYIWYDIKNRNLKDGFDWSEYNHQLNMTNMLNPNLFNGDIKYDFIYRGRGAYDDLIMKNVDICERRPAIKLSKVLEKIFDGYNIDQKIWDENVYENIYITPTGQDLPVTDNWFANSFIDNYIETGNVVSFGNTNLSNVFGINTYWFRKWWDVEEGLEIVFNNPFTYVASETASYRFSGRLKGFYNISSNTPGYWRNRAISVFIIKKKLDNSTETYTFNINSLPNLFTSFINETFDITYDTKLIHLEKDESISIEIKYENREFDSGNNPIIPPQTQTILGQFDDQSYFRVNPFPHKGFNSLITGTDILPDMKVDDFLISLFTNFNIEFYYNFETKTIYLQNRYVYRPPVYDITDKIIENTYEVDLKRPPANYLFSYTNDGNDFFFNNQVEKQYRDDGNLLIDNGEDNKIVEISNSFSYNMMRLKDPKIIAMHNESDLYSTDFNVRLMFYSGMTNYTYTLHTAGIINPFTLVQTQIPLFTNNISGETLSFNNVDSNIGIYDKYFNDNIGRLLEGSVINVDMFIDEQFLSNIYYLNGRDLRAVFYINVPSIQGYYQLVKAERKENYIYRCKLFRDTNYDWSSANPQRVGDFNDDFNADFKIS